MTSRQRILNTIQGKQVDRLPVAPFIHNNFIYEFFGSEDIDVVEKGIEVYEHFGFDVILRTCSVWDVFDIQPYSSKDWTVKKLNKIMAEDNEWEEVTTIITPEKTLTQVKQFRRVAKYDVVSAQSECFIKNESDFEQFVKYQPPVKQYDCSAITRAKHLLGERGVTAPWAQGAFNSVRELRKLDDLLMDAYINPGFYNSMLRYFSDRMLKAIEQFAAAGADIISCEGNAATGNMVGPDYFEEFVLPYEKEFCRKVKEVGVYYLYHNCGDSSALLNHYNEIGMDIFETMTPPPFGDVDIDNAIRRIDKTITLSGNIDQIEFLRNASPHEVHEKTAELAVKAKQRGGFIIATSDYINDNTPYENLFAFSSAAKQFA